MLDVLNSAGFGKADARRAYGVIHTYTVGFAALEASRGKSAASDDERADDVMRELAKLISPTQFKVGLQLLLDGVCSDHEEGHRDLGLAASIAGSDECGNDFR